MKYKTKDILKIERMKRGWRQKDVAEMLHMAPGSYAKYETGDNIPTTENILKENESERKRKHKIKNLQAIKTRESIRILRKSKNALQRQIKKRMDISILFSLNTKQNQSS